MSSVRCPLGLVVVCASQSSAVTTMSAEQVEVDNGDPLAPRVAAWSLSGWLLAGDDRVVPRRASCLVPLQLWLVPGVPRCAIAASDPSACVYRCALCPIRERGEKSMRASQVSSAQVGFMQRRPRPTT